MFMWAPGDAPRGTTSPSSHGGPRLPQINDMHRPPVQGMPLCFWGDECPINTSGDNVTCDGAGSDTDWAARQRARRLGASKGSTERPETATSEQVTEKRC